LRPLILLWRTGRRNDILNRF